MARFLGALAVLVLVAACTQNPSATTTLPTNGPEHTTVTTTETSVTVSERDAGTSEVCDGDVTFEHAPVDLDAVEYLMPFGLMTGSHVTPVDHQYFQNFVDPEREIAVYSPGAGRVVSIQHFGTPVSENPEGVVDDFRLVIEHTCTVSSIFIHIGELIPRLDEHDPGIGGYASIDEPVDAGEQIGTFTQNIDYNVVDLDHTVTGLVDPASYEQEPWKIHVPDTFEYFTEEIVERMANLSLRNAEPRGGRFAYDVDGRLVGNWFLEGTNGYGGVDPDRYWAGHLTFAYDHLDPNLIVVSIGTFDGESRQFAVLGNTPDPSEVSAGSGTVIYDLVGWDYYVGGEHWDRMALESGIEALADSRVEGVIAVELVGPRELRVEVAPGRSSDDFPGFSAVAQTYTR